MILLWVLFVLLPLVAYSGVFDVDTPFGRVGMFLTLLLWLVVLNELLPYLGVIPRKGM